MLRKSVIITGATGGIGRETALLFAERGYNVVLSHHNAPTKELEKQIKDKGVEVKSFDLELEDEKSIKTFFEKTFKSFEYIDAVVLCAGIAEKFQFLFEQEVPVIDKIINTNLRGTLLCNREALSCLTKQKHGNIVNIASIYGTSGGSFESAYSATKGGIIALTKSLALEVAPFGLRVNAVAPGFIDTNMTSGIQGNDREQSINQTPLKRLGTGKDIANMIYFLASEEASFITGECYSVTGGVLRFD